MEAGLLGVSLELTEELYTKSAALTRLLQPFLTDDNEKAAHTTTMLSSPRWTKSVHRPTSWRVW